MTKYHAVMRDECGGEFGADVEASNRDEAYDKLSEDYPESQVVQLESPSDTLERERRIYADAVNGVDYDDDGRPFMHHDDYDFDEED